MADYVGFAGRLDRARDALAQAGLDALPSLRARTCAT